MHGHPNGPPIGKPFRLADFFSGLLGARRSTRWGPPPGHGRPPAPAAAAGASALRGASASGIGMNIRL